MQQFARYLSICLMILGFLTSPASNALAATAKPLSDLQLDDSRLNDEDIVCWSLNENDPRLGADGGPYFVLKPGIDIAKSERSKKTFLLSSPKNGKDTDNLVALRGDGIPDGAKKSSDIPFTPEVLEISRTDITNSLGLACFFVSGSGKKMRISELTDSLEDGEKGPGKNSRRRFQRGSFGPTSRGRSGSGYKLLNPCF